MSFTDRVFFIRWKKDGGKLDVCEQRKKGVVANRHFVLRVRTSRKSS